MKCIDCKYCYKALNLGHWHYCTYLERSLTASVVESKPPDDCPIKPTEAEERKDLTDHVRDAAEAGHTLHLRQGDCARLLEMLEASHLTDEDARELISLIDKYKHYSFCDQNHTENHINLFDFINSLKG